MRCGRVRLTLFFPLHNSNFLYRIENVVCHPFRTATLFDNETIEGQIGEGCRGDKEELMSKVYDCLLPPLPMPFSEFCNSPTTMLYSHFSRVLEVEMAGLRYKGGPLPEKILEWFKWDQSIFNAIRGATYHKTLPGL